MTGSVSRDWQPCAGPSATHEYARYATRILARALVSERNQGGKSQVTSFEGPSAIGKPFSHSGNQQGDNTPARGEIRVCFKNYLGPRPV